MKADIARRIANENAQNARVIKEAREKKDQANKFANKGGSMRKAAQKLKEEAEKLQSAIVEVRKEDKTLKPFEIPVQELYQGKGSATLAELGGAVDPRRGRAVRFRTGKMALTKGTHLRVTRPNGIGECVQIHDQSPTHLCCLDMYVWVYVWVWVFGLLPVHSFSDSQVRRLFWRPS